MTNWDILGIEETDDIGKVRSAYAQKSKLYHPETHPVEFKQLHAAYKAIINHIRNKSVSNKELHDVITAHAVGVKGVKKPASEAEIENAREREIELKKAKTIQAEEEFLWRIEDLSRQKYEERYEDMPLKELEELLKNEYYQENWRKYFTSPGFLKYQYNPEYINAITEIIEKKLREKVDVMGEGGGRMPQFALIYLINAYGCLFDNVGLLKVTETIYNREMLGELKKALLLFDGIYWVYLMIEQREDLLSDRYAFYVYRNILEILEQEVPDRGKLKEWLVDGFMKENRSHLLDITYSEPHNGVVIWGNVKRRYNKISRSPIFFELMIFLLSKKEAVSKVFREVLKEVCNMRRTNDDDCDEIILLKMMLEEQ